MTFVALPLAMSGRSDRVVSERVAKAKGNPKGEAAFATWERRRQELIHCAEGESWTLR